MYATFSVFRNIGLEKRLRIHLCVQPREEVCLEILKALHREVGFSEAGLHLVLVEVRCSRNLDLFLLNFLFRTIWRQHC